ncbi:MAG: 23S rRNA (adenine(2503)-C(2))-methyltransferase RlmN [Candidatus Moranbacteria bacterium]|nr:23S rRNA (adenine(2503)-C(2))-methyltransferase RlmN [Candidatus Moranbacteria bacterium]
MKETREQRIGDVLSDESSFRTRQATEAIYSPFFRSWYDVTPLSKAVRNRLAESVPWNTLSVVAILSSASGDTWKVLFQAADGNRIESVLMRNSRGQFTVCVSTQIGCAMSCAFCATGKLGLLRNLSQDEIVDQVRFLREYVSDSGLTGEITNIVLMGMGEPLANYEEVRGALRTFIGPMGIGTTRITVSTVGLLAGLDRLISDPEWPPVRIAISLHAADERTRTGIMPTTALGFFDGLVDWSKRYADVFPEKRRHLTLEYLLLSGINDAEGDARKLVVLTGRMGKVRINLIPYNATDGRLVGSSGNAVHRFRDRLEAGGVTVTIRKSQGGDIAAACGQLAGKAD